MKFFPQELEFSARKNHLFFRAGGVSSGNDIMIEGLCCTVEAKVSQILSIIFLIRGFKGFVRALTRMSFLEILCEKTDKMSFQCQNFQFVRIIDLSEGDLWPLTDDFTAKKALNFYRQYRIWPTKLRIIRSDLEFSCHGLIVSEGTQFEGRISEEWMLHLIESIIKGDAVYLPGNRKDNSLDAIFATHNFFDIHSPETYPPSTFLIY